jgi:threonylcarbamoyladenosine tRNA methylthiotransferase MtaB
MDQVKKTAAIVTLGCKTNQFESSVMEERLLSSGYEIVPFESGADLVVVNTCTVTSATDSQSRNLIRRSYRLNPDVRIVVTGCYAQMRPDAFREFSGVSLVLGNEEKNSLLEFLDKENLEQNVHVSDIRDNCRPISFPAASYYSRSRAFLQVQNGCDAFCSYCIIPYARGKSRSLPMPAILQKIQALKEEGFKEVVLTGIHLGDFGRDLSPAMTFSDLVNELERQSGIRRLRIGSIEPNEIPDRLIDIVADSENICPHFHIPLQSGDDRILARMRRPYTTKFFRDLVMKINSRISDVGIGIDVISGFPGETDQEFQNTWELIDSLPISYLHVFPFSPRPGTEAAGFPDQIPKPLIKERAECLRILGEKKKKEFMNRYLGETVEVVVETWEEGFLHRGLSRNYLKVLFPCPEDRARETVSVLIKEISSQGVTGEIVTSDKEN